jgi:hypothetical protein
MPVHTFAVETYANSDLEPEGDLPAAVHREQVAVGCTKARTTSALPLRARVDHR